MAAAPLHRPPISVAVLTLLDRSRDTLESACRASEATERYRDAHLGALRAAAALVAARTAPTPRSRTSVARLTPVGCQNPAMASDQRFQAAASYSLRRPPRIGRRRIRPWTGLGTGDVGRGGRNCSARCGRAGL